MADQRASGEKAGNLPHRKTATLPRSLSAYCGTYLHPAYGELTTRQRGDSLQFTYYRTVSALRHSQGDVFENAVRSQKIDQQWGNNKFIFQGDATGQMAHVTISPMPEADMPIRFARRQDQKKRLVLINR